MDFYQFNSDPERFQYNCYYLPLPYTPYKPNVIKIFTKSTLHRQLIHCSMSAQHWRMLFSTTASKSKVISGRRNVGTVVCDGGRNIVGRLVLIV